MATILFNGEDIGDAYAPSLNAAFRELYLASGRAPLVKSPLGGRRTLWQAIRLGTGSRSDHYKGRAVDIDNQRWFRNWNEPRFLGILAKHGWRNVQINGDPFPREPWHFANQSAHPAGSPGVLLPGEVTTRRRSTMTTMYYTTKNDKPDSSPSNVENFYLAGDGAGDAAWIVAPRREVASGWSIPHGPTGTHLLKSEMPAIRAAYLSGAVGGGTGTVPADAAVLAELQKITAALTNLPAEIDRYADGRKQAS